MKSAQLGRGAAFDKRDERSYAKATMEPRGQGEFDWERWAQPVRKLGEIPTRARRWMETLRVLQRDLQYVREALGRIEARQLTLDSVKEIAEAELRVFSQWGEDGIFQWLFRHVPAPKRFVEFGVENYSEANTRFLLMKDGWEGLVIDGDPNNVETIRRDALSWRYPLYALQSFITRENIDGLLRSQGFVGDIGLLSIDIDGNDYWVWERIECVRPSVVVVEYNHRFGPERAVSIPYDAEFRRSQAHHSCVYYGASLKAFWLLGQRKGYDLVGCNRAGNNAFFVRRDLRPEWMKAHSAESAFVPGRFREARDEEGRMLMIPPEEEIHLIAHLPLVEIS